MTVTRLCLLRYFDLSAPTSTLVAKQQLLVYGRLKSTFILSNFHHFSLAVNLHRNFPAQASLPAQTRALDSPQGTTIFQGDTDLLLNYPYSTEPCTGRKHAVMRVMEKVTDRMADIHVHVEGQVDALEEYGEYVDATDKAVCCYVPVDEGHKVRVFGRFNGTTVVIAYDVIVDGILRKASSYTAKSVYFQKHKKLDAEKFLYKSGKDVIDTDMLVAPISGVTAISVEGKETVGTMELRLYVTRQLGVTHAPVKYEKYDRISENSEDDEVPKYATYKLIAPTYQMDFEKNAAPLEDGELKREHRKMNTKRPGTEPWAIFRFHYRSKDAIIEYKLGRTYDPRSKDKPEPYTLNLEPVPPLSVGIKPQKDDGTSSTHTSSPAPDVPLTPTNAPQKGPVAKSPTLLKKQLLKPTTTPPTTPKMASSTTKKDSTKTPDTTLDPEVRGEVNEDVLNRVFTKTSPAPHSPETSFTPINKAAATGDNTSVASATSVDGEVDKAASASKNNMVNSGTKDTGGSDVVKNAAGKSSDKAIDKPIKRGKTIVKEPAEKPVEQEEMTAKEVAKKPATKEDPVTSDTIAVIGPKRKTTSTKEGGAAKPAGLPQKVAKPANGNAKKPASSVKTAGKKEPQVVIPPKKSPVVPVNTVPTSPSTPKRPAPEAPVTPEDQVHVGLIDGSKSHSKRPKFTPSPLTPTSTTIVPRIPSGTSSPRLMSVERKVAEQRKKLEAIRQMRLETAKKQEVLDKKMEPHKKRMEEELERLNREMMEEEAAAAEDEEHFKASEEMLREFETVE
ncbi:hypothetical protein HBI71_114180 [Parastagonospora nodorum]|nr:hypothetical protein HBI71_114180 [Parastagonospora nodorum]